MPQNSVLLTGRKDCYERTKLIKPPPALNDFAVQQTLLTSGIL